MTLRTSKRQRKLAIHPSEVDTGNQNNDIGRRHVSRQTIDTKDNAVNPSSDVSQPPSEPFHVASPSPAPSHNNANSNLLHNFLRPAVGRAHTLPQKVEPGRDLKAQTGESGGDNDIIEDDYDSFDELFTQHFMDGKGKTEKDSRFPIRTHPDRPSRTTSRPRNVASKKRFVLPQGPEYKSKKQGTMPFEGSRLPWAQQYPPLNLDELAVHKRKVSEVEGWLRNAFAQGSSRLLVLRGPAGCGKTTTVSLLSDTLGIDILEWKNPSAAESSREGYVSFGTIFHEFLGRGNKFGGLDLDGGPLLPEDRGHDEKSAGHRIILIEEFPTTFPRETPSLLSFRRCLLQYLALDVSSARGNDGAEENGQASPPIVMVVSETLLNSGPSSSENFTVHRLLGPQIYNHPKTTIIDFNSIAPTFMSKALHLVLEKESRFSNREKSPAPAVIKSISETGDIRSAVSSLEFFCLKNSDLTEWDRPTTRKRKAPKTTELSPIEKQRLGLISQRESTLGLFHAVGKIVYNKRENRELTAEDLRLPSPPAHLVHQNRPYVSQVSIDDLIVEAGTDTQTFICALHENYAPSCAGTSFTDCLSGCMEALSDSDVLCADHRGFRRRHAGIETGMNRLSGGADMLRQDEMSYQVAARGLLFALPYPVQRQVSSTGGSEKRRNVHRLFFPTGLRLFRDAEEIDGILHLWERRLLISSPLESGFIDLESQRKVPTQERNCLDMQPAIAAITPRNDLLLYQLPYMARLCRSETELSEIRKITSFNGITRQVDLTNGDDIGTNSEYAPTLNSLEPLESGNLDNKNTFGSQELPVYEMHGDRLILSDDDIVDD